MNITLHLPTAAITIAIGSLALFGMSASAPQGPASDRDIQAFEDVSRPRPNDLVWIYSNGGTGTVSYTVPAGKSLVITGANGSASVIPFSIDGGPTRFIVTNGEGSVSLYGGISLAEGQTINISPTNVGSLFGHLVDV